MMGVPGPRLFPEFSPVIESTEFGRSLPRLVWLLPIVSMDCERFWSHQTNGPRLAETSENGAAKQIWPALSLRGAGRY